MSNRSSLLDDYNRAMRRRMGRESLAEKLEAIRNGTGFRPSSQARDSYPEYDQAVEAETAQPAHPIHE